MSLLRDRRFALLWLACLLSEIGDWLLVTALPIYVLRLTGSGLITSTVFVVELVPGVVLGSVAGVFVDRWDPRRTIMITSMGQALLVLPLLVVHSSGQLWLIYAVSAARAVLTIFFEPARNTVLPALVDEGKLVPANSLLAMTMNLGRLIGAPLGGLLIATGTVVGVVAGDVAAFVVVVVLIALLRAPVVSEAREHRPDGGPGGFRRAWLEGVRALGCGTQVRISFVVTGLIAVAQGLFVVLILLFVTRVLRGGGAEIGLLRGVQAVGGIAGGLLVSTAGRRLPAYVLLTVGVFSFGLLSLAIWNLPLLTVVPWPYVVLFVAAGVPGIGLMSGLTSLLQQRLPASLLGRAFGLFVTVHTGGQALGMLLADLLADRIGVVPVLDGQAGLYLLAGAVALFGLPALRTPFGKRAMVPPAPTPRGEDVGDV